MLKFAEFFIKRPKVANLTLFLIVLMGVLTWTTLKRQADPTIDFQMMMITTEYLGASPEDVEINVTDPIEDELRGVEDIDEMSSVSMENVSIITITINPDAQNPDRVKNDVRDAADRVSDLPEQVTDKPSVVEIRSTNMPVLEIGVMGDIPEAELRQYAKDLEDELSSAQGIGTIEKVGFRKKEVHISADQERLDDRYVSLNEIMNAIKARNVRTTGGSLESYVSEKKIVTFSEYDEPLDVADVIIRSTFTGSRVKISDVARVDEGFDDHTVIPRANGRNAIALIVRAQGTADVITLSEEIKGMLERFREGLPEGVTADIIYDNSDATRSLLSLVRSNGLMGFALVLVVMLLFLDWKSAFWTAFGIPISICGALIFFPFFDITLNQVSLAAIILVLGMLVDDAIVISENVYRMKERGMEGVAATIAGVKEVFWPVAASVLTTILAFLPMLFMTGLIGKFVVAIPIVVLLMLGWSLIESTCFLPCHIAHVKPPKVKPIMSRSLMPRFQEWYKTKLMWALENRWKVLGLYMTVFAVVIVAASVWLKFIIFPVTDPDLFHVIIETPVGTPLTKTAEKVTEVEAVIKEVVPKDALRSYITRVGNHEINTYVEVSGGHDNYALVTTHLIPAEDRDVKAEDIIEEVEERLKGLTGYHKLYVELPEAGPPVGKPINVIYISDDDDLRAKFEEETLEYLKTIEGVFAVESNNLPGKDELRLKLDYDQMAKLGITAIDVSRTVRAAFDGEVVTSVRKGGEELDFRVRLTDPKKYRAEGVLELMVVNNMNKLVPLGSFAKFEETKAPASMHHYDGRRSVTVSGEVDTDVITSTEVNALVDKKFGPKALEHAGFKMSLKGEQEKTEESMESFYLALSVALVAIFFLLVVLFDSFSQPILIMSAIPLGIIGVLITFMVHGLPLGFIALIGILGLTGVVINTSIVMISTINEECARAGGKSFAAIVDAAALRFRPVVLTTVTTVAGLFPTAYGIGGDLPFIRPMVLAMAWGLVFATFISLMFIPLIYSVQGKVKN